MWRATHLQQRVSSDVGQELLEAESPRLDDFVRETVREDLAGERWDVDAHGLALEQVAEGLEVGVASSHERVAKLECGDIRLMPNCQGVRRSRFGRNAHTLVTIS